MFETLTHYELQQYWWIIIALLGALLVFLMFVQGGQTLIYTIGKSEIERTMLINTLGRKWEFTFTTLVTFGGAFFASFPLFYSTSFGGAYWVWMIILMAFVVQAVSYEYRSKPNNLLGTRAYEVLLFINGLIGTIFIGTAVATFFTGSEFSVNILNQSKWETPWHGLELIFNAHNLSLGLTLFFLSRSLGLLYFMNTVDNQAIFKRSQKQLWFDAMLFILFFLIFTIWLMLRDGFAVNPVNKEIFLQPNKYLLNLIEMPLVLTIFLTGAILTLAGISISLLKETSSGIWVTGPGTILTVFALFLIAGFNNTSFYPSTYDDLQSSLTIQNASSSYFTLKVMSYVSLMVPFVAAYIWYAWRSINNKKIDMHEITSDETHVY